MSYNYEAVGNKIATEILNSLVMNDGTCVMLKSFRDILTHPKESNMRTKQPIPPYVVGIHGKCLGKLIDVGDKVVCEKCKKTVVG